MVVTNTDEKQIYASVQFLKWFTEDERNIRFSVASGYLPVTKSANDVEKIQANASLPEGNMLSIISAAINTVNQNTLYTTKAFENGTSARSILEYSMSDKAAEDRAAAVSYTHLARYSCPNEFKRKKSYLGIYVTQKLHCVGIAIMLSGSMFQNIQYLPSANVLEERTMTVSYTHLLFVCV